MHVLFDLDGTLIDPKPGIIGSVRFALAELGLTAPPEADMHWVIGPPLRTTFPLLGVSPERVETALDYYRQRYRDGAMYDAEVYRGVPDALDALRAAGCRLVVATSKPHVFARPILERFELAARFVAVHGAELDGVNDDKGELVGHIIAREGIDPRRAVMVGDRRFDVLAAKQHDVPSIGVTWGYGSIEELTSEGATTLVDTPSRLSAAVLATLRGR